MEIFAKVYLIVTGLFVGSFLNVLADRLPRGEDVISARSHCDKCKKPLRWWELIPVISYIALGGRCARCKTSLSVNYPLTELLTALMAVLFWQISGGDITLFVLQAVIAACLFVIFFSDLRYRIIPDSMFVIGLSAAVAMVSYRWGPVFLITNSLPAAIGAAVFFLILFLVTKGNGMGFGDVKLVLFLGLVAGYPGIIIALYAAFLTGAAVGVILVLAGRKKLKSHVPFGPFLIAGTVFSLLFGSWVTELWKGVI